MLRSIIIPFFAGMLFSCSSVSVKNSTNDSTLQKNVIKGQEQISFFPLTNFIMGQLTEIKTSGINPLKYNFKAGCKDSAWIKMEQIDNEFSELLSPYIDSSSMSRYFKESSFWDETLSKVTLAYDPIKDLPENISWLTWNIYIDPETNSVSRVYMVKKLPNNLKKQITLIPGKSCRMTTLNEKANNLKSAKISDILIKWDL